MKRRVVTTSTQGWSNADVDKRQTLPPVTPTRPAERPSVQEIQRSRPLEVTPVPGAEPSAAEQPKKQKRVSIASELMTSQQALTEREKAARLMTDDDGFGYHVYGYIGAFSFGLLIGASVNSTADHKKQSQRTHEQALKRSCNCCYSRFAQIGKVGFDTARNL
jgi:hypothetical protein